MYGTIIDSLCVGLHRNIHPLLNAEAYVDPETLLAIGTYLTLIEVSTRRTSWSDDFLIARNDGGSLYVEPFSYERADTVYEAKLM